MRGNRYDAAVIDQQNGKRRVVKRMDRPHIGVIPEWFGGGTLPRKELYEADEELTASQAGLIAVGEPTIGTCDARSFIASRLTGAVAPR